MTSTINPWAAREAIDAARRAAQEQQQAVADPPTDFSSQRRDRIAEMLHAALPAGFDLALIDGWASLVDGATPAPTPELTALSDSRVASMERQMQNLVQAMASFSPPAAGLTARSVENSNNLQPVIAANWQ